MAGHYMSTKQDATRKRRWSKDAARRAWYAKYRQERWKRHYFGA